MTVKQESSKEFFDYFLKRLRCPTCLSDLSYAFVDGKCDLLTCTACNNAFLVSDGLPILLISDENWPKKIDEIDGEVGYNTKKISLDVHLERNEYINSNTEKFLEESRVDLSNSEILVVGCAQLELEFFVNKCKGAVAIDIVPLLTKGCLTATRERNIPAFWVCGDGECIPFEDESFDAVIVRQSLHHMLKYYSAISEFFRVCKKGGHVLIIDEPFLAADLYAAPLSSLPDEFPIYEGIKLGHIREELGIQDYRENYHGMRRLSSSIRNFFRTNKQGSFDHIRKELFGGKRPIFKRKDFSDLEIEGHYIQPDRQDPETYLADKYYSFSALQCIHALRLHTQDFQLIWPKEIAWTKESDDEVIFCRGPNPNFEKSLIQKLVSAGNLSLAARKAVGTTVLRDRSGLNAIPVDLASKLANPGFRLNSCDEMGGETPMAEERLYALPLIVKDLQDCFFYQLMDIPGVGVVGKDDGQWDLRDCVSQYLGELDYRGKRALDVGTASGFLSFEMEKKGAEVVSFDMDVGNQWDIVPHFETISEQESIMKGYNQVHQRLKNAYWFAHRNFKSSAKMYYGNVYDLPDDLGKFDVVVLGMILRHLRDPFQALYSASRLSMDTVVVTEQFMEGGDPVAHFLPNAKDKSMIHSWWALSDGCLKEMLGVLGFNVKGIIRFKAKCLVPGLEGYHECKAVIAKKLNRA